MEIRSVVNIDSSDITKLFESSRSYWFHHSPGWIEYTLNMREAGSRDLSFGVYQDNKLVAVAPLVKEYILGSSDRDEFSMAGLPSNFPVLSETLTKKNRDRVEKVIFENIFDLAEKEKISYMNFCVSPLTIDSLEQSKLFSPLLKFGFHDTSVTTNILQLGRSDDDIYKGFRKGTKSDIKTAIKTGAEVELYSAKNITEEIFDKYREIHFRASGRQTRPDRTWEIMLTWIKEGASILSLVRIKDNEISAQIVNTFQRQAYYHSGATLPEYSNLRGIGHLAQWEIIKFLNRSGFDHYDLGINVYPNISQEVGSEKMLGISRFKAGFGAEVRPYFRGEWFRDKEFMLSSLSERVEKFFGQSQ